MANELTLSFSSKLTKGTLSVPQWSVPALLVTVSGDNPVENTQSVGTSAEALVLGDVGTCGYFMAKNLDATNYVEIFPDNAGSAASAKLKAGEVALFRLGTSTPYAKANTASCRLQYRIIPD